MFCASFLFFGEGWRGVNEVLSVSDMIVWVVPYYGIELLFFFTFTLQHCYFQNNTSKITATIC